MKVKRRRAMADKINDAPFRPDGSVEALPCKNQ